jgi:hypothetical protein
MMQGEIETAAREILDYLESHGEVPVIAAKNALGKRELHFYMGLGNLILQSQVTIQERGGVFWAIRALHTAQAA